MQKKSDFVEKQNTLDREKEEAVFFDREMFELRHKIETTGKDNFYCDFVFDIKNLTFKIDKSVYFALQYLGNTAGKKVLDCGCGNGFSTIFLAQKGAAVSAFDISQGAVELTRHRAELNKVSDKVKVIRSSFNNLPYENDSFDFIYGGCILHHVDLAAVSKEINRLLKKGGKAVFVENSSTNRIIMFLRKYVAGRWGVPKYGTSCEEPLTREKLELLKRDFIMKLHYPDFMFFKKVYYLFRGRIMNRMAEILDDLCHQVPGLRKYSYFFVIELGKK